MILRLTTFLYVSLFLYPTLSAQHYEIDAEVQASDANYLAEYGTSVGISGNYAIVGAPMENFDADGANELAKAGAAYIYEKGSNGIWIEKQKLVPLDRGSIKQFGFSVAIRGDFAVIGAPFDHFDAEGANPVTRTGSAYVFKRNDAGLWTQTQKLADTERTSHANYGSSVAISEAEIMIGSKGRKNLGSDGELLTRGGVLVYHQNTTGDLEFHQLLLPPESIGPGLMGTSIAIHENAMIAGAPHARYQANPDMSISGGACIFTRGADSLWSYVHALYPQFNGHYSLAGSAVAINEHYAAMGVPDEGWQLGNSVHLSNSGAVDIFEKLPDGNYAHHHQLTNEPRQAGEHFGSSVAFLNDMLFIGAPGRDVMPPSGFSETEEAGAVYMHVPGGPPPVTITSTLIVPDRNLGMSLAADNGTIISGAPRVPLPAPWTTTYFSGSALIFNVKGTVGRIFLDLDVDCASDPNEGGLPGFQATINPGGIQVTTNENGIWFTDELAPGEYTLSAPAEWLTYHLSCDTVQTFTISENDFIAQAPEIGYFNTEPCAIPSISVVMPFMRPCFEEQIILMEVCNGLLSSAPLLDPYVDLNYDTLITIQSANHPYDILEPGLIRINLPDIALNSCLNIELLAQVSCEAPLGLTLCLEAALSPNDPCIWEAIPATVSPEPLDCENPYDNSHLNLFAHCENLAASFTIKNEGTGNMDCHSHYSIFKDGQLFANDSVLLASGETYVYDFDPDGYTWHLEVNQHPEHPEPSHPIVHLEACGNPANWTPGLVSVFPDNDASPLVDVYCGEVTGSYDPNDKRGFPRGVGDANCIAPNTALDYMIRFQNTGTDTAFTVVIVDTLDMDLNPLSLVSGVSSHPYTLAIEDGNVLKWTFDHILLPDSNINEALSHGFVSFKVSQAKDLPDGSDIFNTAAIYFDFNDPIITNTTHHHIRKDRCIVPAPVKPAAAPPAPFTMFPNPALNDFHIDLDKTYSHIETRIYNLRGSLMYIQKNKDAKLITIDYKASTGVYVVRVNADGDVQHLRLVSL